MNSFGQSNRTEKLPLTLLVSLAAIACLVFTFLKLWSEIAEGDAHALDGAILLSLRVPGHPDVAIGPYWLSQAMINVTSLGSGLVLALLTIGVSGFLIVKGAHRTAAVLIAATMTGSYAVTLLKRMFDRPRPELVDHLVEVQSMSFPSGHAANSALVYLTMGILLAKVEGQRALKAYIMVVAILLTMLVGFSRVYLGVHWPSDVVGGWAFGAAWALLWHVISVLAGSGRAQAKRG